jgi:DNA-binding transcriptional LysR family regulator
MDRTSLDIDILRTLVTAQSLGGFNRAAQRIGRSQSAVSQQVSRLEDRLGKQIFRKEGRGLVPTEAGDMLLAYARRILDLTTKRWRRFAVLPWAAQSDSAYKWI